MQPLFDRKVMHPLCPQGHPTEQKIRARIEMPPWKWVLRNQSEKNPVNIHNIFYMHFFENVSLMIASAWNTV